MSRNLTSCLQLLVVALLATACSSPRRASERACAKAEKHRARAIWLCPQALLLDSATARFQLPAQHDSAAVRLIQAELDSVRAACEQLSEALDAERELYQAALQQQPTTLPTPPKRGSSEPAQRALQALRKEVCAFEPQEVQVGLCIARVTPGTNAPLLYVEQLPLDTMLRAPCPPQLTAAPIYTGVATWYRTGFWVVLALFLIILGLFIRMVQVAMRNHQRT